MGSRPGGVRVEFTLSVGVSEIKEGVWGEEVEKRDMKYLDSGLGECCVQSLESRCGLG